MADGGQVNGELSILDEEARLDALHQLGLLDTPPSEGYDRITRLASRALDAPVAAISLTDRHRQWCKSLHGATLREVPREHSPSAVVTASGEALVINDLRADPRFAGGMLAEAGARFYAGAPLVTRDGYRIGALSVLDCRPRMANGREAATLCDLAAMVMAQIELERRVGHVEPTSGLPNRIRFVEETTALAARQPGGALSCILIEIADGDQIAAGSRVLGAAYAEGLTRSASSVVRAVLGEGTSLYAIGPTQLALLLPEADPRALRPLLERLHAQLGADTEVRGVPVAPNPVIGAAPVILGETTPEDMLRIATSALHDARAADARLGFYCASRDEVHRRRFGLLADLRVALHQTGQLSLAYQPRIDVVSGAVAGAEALLRWRHPVLGDVSPGEFIPLVEQTSLVKPMTERVIEMALSQIAAWRAAGLAMRIAVNVSAANLEEEDFGVRLKAAVARHGVDSHAFEIEFTESTLIRDRNRVLRHLHELRDFGIATAIDDFGTGYSSFAYLKDIPADVVKIDRSFMRGLESEARDRTLVRTIIAMSHDLGFRVVAEGVESQTVYDMLAEWSCDEVQGFLISRPLGAPAFADWVDGRGRSPADRPQPAPC